MNSSRPTRTAMAQRGSSSKCQHTTSPATTSSRSATGSSSAPSREHWPVTRSRRLGEQPCDGCGGALQRSRALLAAAPELNLQLPAGERPAPDRHAQGAAEQLGLDELLARASGAIVVEHLEAGVLQLGV